jgi:hypothetical protein
MFGVLLFWPLVRADGQGFVFNAVSPGSVGAGNSLTLTLSVTPLPWDGVMFGHGGAAPANSFPTNASLDSTSGFFAWTPNTNQLGVNRITIWAFEPSAQWVSNYTTFTVTVTNVATPVSGIVIDPIGPQPVVEGTTLTFTNHAQATDNPANALVFSLINAPSGATMINNSLTSGVFTWTPTASQALTPSYTIREMVTEPSASVTNYQDFQVTVTRSNNCAQLDEFLAAVQQGGYFLLSNCTTIVLPSTLTISKSVTLDAGTANVTIAANSSNRLFTVLAGVANFTLRGITLSGGQDANGGALYINQGATVLLTNCTLVGNSATGAKGLVGIVGSSGGINGGNGGNGTTGKSALGGAIHNLGSLTALNCVFATNSAFGGTGGTGGGGGNGVGTLSLGGDGGHGGNGAPGDGGAIYNAGSLSLSNCTFSGNSVVGGSGGLGGTNGTGNFAGGKPGSGGTGMEGSGAAVYSANNSVIVNCTFSGNVAQGGNSVPGGTDSNAAGVPGAPGANSLGGAIYNVNAGFITNCTFSNNQVTGGNGGDGGTGTGTLSYGGNGGNGGSGLGGGLFNAGSVVVVNCTFSGCGGIGGTNGLAGSGRFAGTDGTPGLGMGGDIAQGSGSFVLQNTILAASSAGGNAFVNSLSHITDGGYNLSSDLTPSLGGTSLKNTNPKISSTLADNGGPTLTLAIVTNTSPAIGKVPLGASPATDQRGIPRPQPQGGLSDIGAYELVTRPAILTQPQSQTIAQGSDATFTVSAFGDSPTYQWRFNGTNIADATLSTYTVSDGQTTDTGNYNVVLTNHYGVVTSLTAVLSVYPYTISGQVLDVDGASGLPDVLVQAMSGLVVASSTNTDADGNYILVGLQAGKYTVTNSLACYRFGPSNVTVTVGPTNAVVRNFFASNDFHVVSGSITNGPASVAVTITGTNGTQMVTSSAGVYGVSNLCAGFYFVVPFQAGYQFQPPTNSILVPPNTNSVNFTAVQVFGISGSVTQGTNGPGLVGLTVAVSGPVATNVTTGANGVYLVGGLPPGTYQVAPAAPACYHLNLPARTVILGLTNAAGMDFVALRDAYAITGHLTNGAAGVSGIAVSAGGTNSAVTDATGSYGISNLCAGSYTVAPSSNCYSITPSSRTVTLGSVDTNGVDFGASAYTISGWITNAPASVTLALIGTNGLPAYVTNSGNSYGFSNLCGGQYAVVPSKPGYQFQPATNMATIPPGTNSLNFTAVQVFVIGGSVTQGTNGPGLAAITVAVSGPIATNVPTGANGSYLVGGLSPGTYQVTPTAPACYHLNLLTRTVTLGPTDASGTDFIALRDAYTISGRITDGGIGVSNATVQAGTQTTNTDSGGNYVLSGLCSGSYTVTPAAACRLFTPTSISVVLGPNTNEVNFVTFSNNLSRIRGRVTDGVNGLSNVLVTATGGSTSISDPGGNYIFSSLCPGAYAITPSLSNYCFNPQSLTVSVGSAQTTNLADLVANPGVYRISGTIDHMPLGPTVRVSLVGAYTTNIVTAANGSYVFPSVCPGTYSVTPSNACFQFYPPSWSTTVGPNDDSLNFAVSGGGAFAIRGQVTLGGLGLSNITVSAGGQTNVTGSDGNYAFFYLCQGVYPVTASSPNFEFAPPTNYVTLSAADANGVNFAATAVFSLSGQVVQGTNGMPGVKISVGTNLSFTGPSGYYTNYNLRGGTNVVVPSLGGYAFAPASQFLILTSNTSGLNFMAFPSLALARATNGWVQLAFAGAFTCGVEASPNLVSWQPVFTTNNISTNTLILEFIDTNAPTFPKRFYRLAETFTGLPILTNWAASPSSVSLDGIAAQILACQIEASTDLKSWTPISTNSLPTNSIPFQFRYSATSNSPVRFYRLFQAPGF